MSLKRAVNIVYWRTLYASMKSTVLSWRLKLATQSVCRRSTGSLFQACRPATENALDPTVDDTRGSLRRNSRYPVRSWLLPCWNLLLSQWLSKALRGPGSTVTWGPSLSLPSTSPSLPFPSPFPSSTPAQPLPAAKRPLNPARGSGERCKLPQQGLGRSPSRNRIWCILALKSVIWWQQFLWFPKSLA